MFKRLLRTNADRLRLRLNRRTWDEMGVFDMSQYSLKVTASSETSQKLNASGLPVYELGGPLTVTWTAPLNHGSKDWIGIYKVGTNSSKKVTNIASKGRYLFTGPDERLGEAEEGVDDHAGKGDGEVFEEEAVWIDEKELCRGRVVFLGDKLPWFEGIFEFRYHHHNRYNVMACSEPFEMTCKLTFSSGYLITQFFFSLIVE